MTTRRGFISSLLCASAGVPLLRVPLSESSAAATARARPTPEQLAWHDLEIGMFIHFAPNTWQDLEYDDRSTPLSAISPDINTHQWADCAMAMGAKYVVFVAKHVGGFCMWQTRTTAYGIRSTAWRGGRGDVMAELAASCRQRGLKLGVYLSPRDDTSGAAGGGRCVTPAQQEAYNVIYRQQLTELLTRYGPITEIWFDGSIVVPVGDILTQHAPHAMIFQGPHATIRWVGNEDGFAPYPAWNSIDRGDARTGIATALHGDPEGDAWLPNEVDVSVRRPNWFWSTKNHVNLLSLDALIEIYYRSVGRGAQLLLNMTPDRRGLIPEADFARAREFGTEIQKRFGQSIGEATGSGDSLTLTLAKPTRIDHVVIQEDLSYGERIREYRLEGRTGRNWVALRSGSAVGHKRIHPIEPHTLDAVRLVVVRRAGTPQIRRFAAFNTGMPPPATWNAPAKVWADDAAGEWREGAFELDLSTQIKTAGKYRLRFVPEGGDVRIERAELLLDGARQPRAVERAGTRSDVLILTIERPIQKVVMRGRVRGAASGTLLLRKL